MFEHCQALNEIVVDRQPMLRSAEDEGLTPQIFPEDGILSTKRMRVRRNDEHAFAPEPDDVAIARNGLPHDESNIELFRAKPRQIIARRPFNDVDFNLGMKG